LQYWHDSSTSVYHKSGYRLSTGERVTAAYKNGGGLVTKEEYADTLRSYHERRKEVKSDDRD